MATPIIMPRQGQSVESCIITKWHKEKGDKVAIGDILFTYETDKATFEEEAQEEGILLDVFFQEGDDVPVLTNVCVIGDEGEDVSPYSPHDTEDIEEDDEKVNKEESFTEVPLVKGISPEPKATTTSEDGRIKISPRARNFAEKIGVDYSGARPTGPEGRIIERDIIELTDKGPILTPAAEKHTSIPSFAETIGTGLGGRITAEDLESITQKNIETPYFPESTVDTPDYEDIDLTNIRKVIARTMHESLAQSAQLTLNASFDATNILDFRRRLKNEGDKMGLGGITLNDIILYVVARTLLNHRDLNAHFLGESMRVFNTVNLGVAIDTPRGLIVPTIFNADRKSLLEISEEVKVLAEDSQKGTINPDLLAGGTFTVTNLGTLGVESFTPVLNPPQTGILGVNNIVERARRVDGEIQYYPAMGLSITFDHRAVDGAPAARFLKELGENLENFSLLLAK